MAQKIKQTIITVKITENRANNITKKSFYGENKDTEHEHQLIFFRKQ